MIVDEVNEYVINQWFDYWSDKSDPIPPTEIIEKLRRLAIAGNSKAKRNNKAIASVMADLFDCMADDVRSGKIKVRAFTKKG
jgi:uncharacterized protein (DUF2267 family)